MTRSSLHLLMILALIGLAACGSDDRERASLGGTDANENIPTDHDADHEPGVDAGIADDAAMSEDIAAYDPCPLEAPYRCPDETCVTEPTLCEPTSLLDGRILSLSPGTVDPAEPETVEITVEIANPQRLNRLLGEGAVLSIALRRGEDIEVLPIESMDSREHLYNLSFTPGAREPGPAARAAVELLLHGAEGAFLGRVNDAVLRFRGHLEGSTIATRSHERLEGLIEPRQAWSIDLDGDGIEDRLVLDEIAESFSTSGVSLGLRTYRCTSPTDTACAPSGVVALPTAADGVSDIPTKALITLDPVVSHDVIDDDEPAGFLFAIVTERTLAEGASRVVVTHLQLEAHDGAHRVQTRDASIVMPTRGGRHWPTDLIKPRIFRDSTGALHLGVVAAGYWQSDLGHEWTALLLDESGQHTEFASTLSSDIVHHGSEGHHVALCAPAGALAQASRTAPEMLAIALYPGRTDQSQTLSVGLLATSEGHHVQRFEISRPASAQGPVDAGIEARHISCRLKDLDGDGIDDLVVALPDSSGRAHLYALRGGIDKADIRRGFDRAAPPQRLLDSVAPQNWEIFRSGDEVYLRAATLSSDGDGFGPPSHLILTAQKAPDSDSFSFELLDQLSAPSGVALISVAIPNAPAAISPKRGHDKVVRKKTGYGPGIVAPGSTGASSTAYLDSSRQLVTAQGTWFATRFTGGLLRPEGSDVLLGPHGPRALIGFYSSAGAIALLPIHDESVDIPPSGLTIAPNGAARLYSLAGDSLRVITLNAAGEEVLIADDHTVPLDFDAVPYTTAADVIALHTAMNSDHDILIALVLKDGRILATSMNGALDGSLIIEDTGLDALRPDASIWLGAIGAEPIIARQGKVETPDGHQRVTSLWSASRGVHQLEGEAFFADILGLGHDQLITIDERDGIRSQMRCESGRLATLSSTTMTPTSADWSDLDGMAQHPSEPVCLDEGPVHTVDLDGDGCADVLAHGSRVFLSRCDGDFDLARFPLPAWTDHLTPGNRARTFSHSVWRFAPETDDAPSALLPFFDALERHPPILPTE